MKTPPVSLALDQNQNFSRALQITCVEEKIESDGKHFNYLILEPFEIGHGITIANAIRRCLLAELTGPAIVGIRINNLPHEFATIPGVQEDTLEVLMNLKEIVFKKNFDIKSQRIRGFLNVQGPIVVTAGMFKLPKDKIKILNPTQYICSILNPSQLFLEIDIDTGKGYKLVTHDEEYLRKKRFSRTKGNTLLIDALFAPIQSANYKIKLINDSKGNLCESVHYEITTNGSLSPRQALFEATKSVINLFLPILVNRYFENITKNITSTFTNEFTKENEENFSKEKIEILKQELQKEKKILEEFEKKDISIKKKKL